MVLFVISHKVTCDSAEDKHKEYETLSKIKKFDMSWFKL